MTDTADAIITALAQSDPIYGSEMDSSSCCIFCFAERPEHDHPESHDEDCVWRRAKSYLGWR